VFLSGSLYRMEWRAVYDAIIRNAERRGRELLSQRPFDGPVKVFISDEEGEVV